jgi:hypothetical protein
MAKHRLYFTHPRSSERYEAVVADECPARLVLQGLQAPNATESGPFLQPAPDGRPYAIVLARTGIQLSPETTMAQVGVRDDDVFEVQQMAQGADGAVMTR